jgi:hypothetical protein
MAKFWCLTCALVVISVLGMGAACLIGGTRSLHFAILFTNPDGTPCQRPCLFGVRPGKTPYDTAIKLLQLHPFTSRFEPDIERGVFSGPGMSIIVFEDDRNYVSRIDLVRTPDASLGSWASLGEVVAVLGAPEVVGVETDSIRSYYLAASMTFFHSGNTDGYVSLDDRFDCLFVFAHPLKAPWEPSWAAWKGFTRVERYRAAMAAHAD